MFIYQTNDDYIEINGIKVPREIQFPMGGFGSCTIIDNQAIYEHNNRKIVFDSSNFTIFLYDDVNLISTRIKTDTKIITSEQMSCLLYTLWENIIQIADPHSQFLEPIHHECVVVNINNTEFIMLPEINAVVISTIDFAQISIKDNGKILIFSLNGKFNLNPVIPLIKEKKYEEVKAFFGNKCTLFCPNKQIVLDNHSFTHNNHIFTVNVYVNETYFLVELYSKDDVGFNVYSIYLFIGKDNIVEGIVQNTKLSHIPDYISTEQLIQWLDLYVENQKQENQTKLNEFDVLKIIFNMIIKIFIRIIMKYMREYIVSQNSNKTKK